jgi:glycerophosphoryl diester phosphodiesterase
METRPIIIAHRGASGYLPEHTIACKAMAHAMDPDFLEQDVVLTLDGRPIVVHDRFLDTVSNVVELFPEKKRKDGRFYAIDFTLEEVKTLRLHERIDLATGRAAFPERFPEHAATLFEIPTLEEEIELIQGLNKSRGRNVGIYTELKAPAFHAREGKRIEETVLDVLGRYGYTGRDSNCYIQCFEPASIIHMREKLKSDLKMIQLIGDESWDDTPGVDYRLMTEPEGLDGVARYADGIGPWMNQIVPDRKGKDPRITELVKRAHERGLCVHPYTFRLDSLPSYAKSFDELLDLFFIKAGVDGIFTDFPDRAAAFLKNAGLR